MQVSVHKWHLNGATLHTAGVSEGQHITVILENAKSCTGKSMKAKQCSITITRVAGAGKKKKKHNQMVKVCGAGWPISEGKLSSFAGTHPAWPWVSVNFPLFFFFLVLSCVTSDTLCVCVCLCVRVTTNQTEASETSREHYLAVGLPTAKLCKFTHTHTYTRTGCIEE